LSDEFNNNNPDNGQYASQQHRKASERLPATTGEFNRMLDAAANKVHQSQADGETSSTYARHRAA
jgi:hypothetical protein